jgi:hypothetical protein
MSWCTDLDSLPAEKTLREDFPDARNHDLGLHRPPPGEVRLADGQADECEYRCGKCGVGIAGRQWYMAGNRKHCSVACSTRTAERLEEDDPSLREGTSAADLVAATVEEE